MKQLNAMDMSDLLKKDIEAIDLIVAVLKNSSANLEAVAYNDCYRELEQTQTFKDFTDEYQKNLEAVTSELSNIIRAIENVRHDYKKKLDDRINDNTSKESPTLRPVTVPELKAWVQGAERQRYFGSHGKKS